jgi:hypothetical protein
LLETCSSCAPAWQSIEHTGYTIYWFWAGFLIPLAIILVTSALTLRHLKEVTHHVSKSEGEKRIEIDSVGILCTESFFLALAVWSSPS